MICLKNCLISYRYRNPFFKIIIVNDSLMTYLLLLTDDLSNPWYTHIFVFQKKDFGIHCLSNNFSVSQHLKEKK